MHLEGALTPDLLFSLAAHNSVTLPSDPIYASPSALQAYYDRPDAFDSLQPFLDLYQIGVSVLQKEEDFHELGMTYFRRAARDNVRHAEVFFDPQCHTARQEGPSFGTVLAGFRSACAEAEASLRISTKLIMCFLRHLPLAGAMETYAAARSGLGDGTIAGIGLDSAEKGFPPELFAEVYELAVKEGINRTAHAGEEAGPDAVASALDNLKVMRIDHGRTIPEDPQLMERIAREKTLVTLCPLSNLKLNGVKSLPELPIRKFLDAGVKFSINSDDPAYFGGWTLDNYCAVQGAFDLTVREWKGICLAAIEGSWCNAKRKEELTRELEEVIQEQEREAGAHKG
ncbi:MAG: hypothetical protein LQ340_007091 [Diploschistes diacapsis]|nr:MAG: hypothetical protein LQ340_007091 [Diploschistes diacapsis]